MYKKGGKNILIILCVDELLITCEYEDMTSEMRRRTYGTDCNPVGRDAGNVPSSSHRSIPDATTVHKARYLPCRDSRDPFCRRTPHRHGRSGYPEECRRDSRGGLGEENSDVTRLATAMGMLSFYLGGI